MMPILLGGYMVAGKNFVGKRLAIDLGWRLLYWQDMLGVRFVDSH